jgi:hypothetical protein
MRKSFLAGLAGLALVVSMSSCDKLPQEKVDAAVAALDSAKIAEAELYVPQLFAQVQDSLKSAQNNIETQKSKMFANFDGVRAQLDAVVAMAADVKVKAAERKEAVKQEIVAVIAEVATIVAENNELIKKAPRGKEGASALEAIKADLAGIDAAVAEAQGAFDSGVYIPTIDKVKAAKDKAVSINAELKAAIEKKKK